MSAIAAQELEVVELPLGGAEDLILDGVIVPIVRKDDGSFDICQIMSEVLDGEHDFLPPDVLDEIDMRPVDCSLSDDVLSNLHFAVPLRRCRERRNCLERRDGLWQKVSFHPSMTITGRYVMIIASKRNQ